MDRKNSIIMFFVQKTADKRVLIGQGIFKIRVSGPKSIRLDDVLLSH